MKKVASEKISKLCEIESCRKPLIADKYGRVRKKYCSKACRVSAMKIGDTNSPHLKYTFNLKYCNDYLLQYLGWCNEGNVYKSIWDPKSKKARILKDVRLPSLGGYSEWLLKTKNIKLPVYTMKYWSFTKVAFALALNRLMTLQEVFLINYGLSNFYNAKVAIFILAVNHGWIKPKYDQVITSQSQSSLAKRFTFMNKITP